METSDRFSSLLVHERSGQQCRNAYRCQSSCREQAAARYAVFKNALIVQLGNRSAIRDLLTPKGFAFSQMEGCARPAALKGIKQRLVLAQEIDWFSLSSHAVRDFLDHESKPAHPLRPWTPCA